MDNIHYCYDKLLSYNALLYFVIGERGVGKTYGAKKYCVSHFKKKRKKFVWLRRFFTDLDTAIGNHKNPCFFNNIKNEFNNVNFSVEENKKMKFLYYNDKICGYGMNLKSAESLKGTEFDDVDTIIFDEFLVGDGGSHYIKNEVMFLLSIIETIGRMRPIKVILLGNATSIYNPYFEFFNIHLPYNSDFQTFKNGKIVVNYIKNEKYRQMKRESDFGQLIKGTDYEKYAIDNQFINDNNAFIKKKHPNSKLFFNISINGINYGVWFKDNEMYISTKHNLSNNTIITFDYNIHNSNTILLKSRHPLVLNMSNHFKKGNLFFENQSIKHKILDIFSKANLI